MTNRPPLRYQMAPAERVPFGFRDLTIRRPPASALSDAELRQIVELLRRAYNNDPDQFRPGVDPLDHMKWKTCDFPGPSYVYLLEIGDRIVYCDLEQYRTYRVRGEDHFVRGGGDVALDLEFQRQGIPVRLADFRRQHRDPKNELAFGLQSHPSEFRRMARGGSMRPLGNVLQNLFRPIDIRRMYSDDSSIPTGPSRTREMIAGSRRFGGSPGLRRLAWRALMPLWRLRYRVPRPAFSGEIESIESFDSEFERFIEEATRVFDFVQHRSVAWLNWRLCDPRSGGFELSVATEDDRIVGYSAVRLDGTRAWIADLLVLPGRADAAVALVEDVIDRAREGGAAGITCWCMSHHPHNRLLRQLGFIPRSVPGILTYSPNRIDPASVAFMADKRTTVHYMLQDQDLV